MKFLKYVNTLETQHSEKFPEGQKITNLRIDCTKSLGTCFE